MQFLVDIADRLSRLASRGAEFGDSSLYITYRNVRIHEYDVDVYSHTSCPQLVILSVFGIPAALLAGWAVEIPYIGRRGSLAISSGESLSSFMHLHNSTTSRGIKRSLARFCTGAPPPGRRTSFWGGTVAMRVAATCVLCFFFAAMKPMTEGR